MIISIINIFWLHWIINRLIVMHPYALSRNKAVRSCKNCVWSIGLTHVTESPKGQFSWMWNRKHWILSKKYQTFYSRRKSAKLVWDNIMDMAHDLARRNWSPGNGNNKHWSRRHCIVIMAYRFVVHKESCPILIGFQDFVCIDKVIKITRNRW